MIRKLDNLTFVFSVEYNQKPTVIDILHWSSRTQFHGNPKFISSIESHKERSRRRMKAFLLLEITWEISNDVRMTALKHHEDLLLNDVEIISRFEFDHFQCSHRRSWDVSSLEGKTRCSSSFSPTRGTNFVNIAIRSWTDALDKFVFIVRTRRGHEIGCSFTLTAHLFSRSFSLNFPRNDLLLQSWIADYSTAIRNHGRSKKMIRSIS